MKRLKESLGEVEDVEALWTLSYWQKMANLADMQENEVQDRFPLSPFDMVFDDHVLDRVRQVWLRLDPSSTDSFLIFDERAGEVDIEDDIS
jgi:hypothetical protein